MAGKRKIVVINLTLFGRVQDIYVLGKMEAVKEKIRQYIKMKFLEERQVVRELNEDKIVRIDLPHDQGLVLKRLWL